MIDKLQAELVKAQDNLNDVVVKVGTQEFSFFFRYLTLLEKVRIEQMCIKVNSITNTDGSIETKHEKQDHLIPIHTILEKALDSEGKRLFSHTNPEHFKLISDLPAGASSYLAYEMSLDIFGTMKETTDAK